MRCETFGDIYISFWLRDSAPMDCDYIGGCWDRAYVFCMWDGYGFWGAQGGL